MDPPARPQGQAGDRERGTFLAIQEKWRAKMHKVKTGGRGWEVCDEGAAGQEWGLNGGGVTVLAHKIGCQGPRRYSLGLAGAADGEPEGNAPEVKGEG